MSEIQPIYGSQGMDGIEKTESCFAIFLFDHFEIGRLEHEGKRNKTSITRRLSVKCRKTQPSAPARRKTFTSPLNRLKTNLPKPTEGFPCYGLSNNQRQTNVLHDTGGDRYLVRLRGLRRSCEPIF